MVLTSDGGGGDDDQWLSQATTAPQVGSASLSEASRLRNSPNSVQGHSKHSSIIGCNEINVVHRRPLSQITRKTQKDKVYRRSRGDYTPLYFIVTYDSDLIVHNEPSPMQTWFQM
ncbi:unnamed protein product [Soboliphyme baturini]|uniref:Ephrin RBD domain-containing protein n=1 Tax=Soboliphyme baturini TaxID=241478 RepID=A0A183J1H7_9BILA|nr:unnamed protein product [Soboliphyme baturini]